jgi:hypothetical protein
MPQLQFSLNTFVEKHKTSPNVFETTSFSSYTPLERHKKRQMYEKRESQCQLRKEERRKQQEELIKKNKEAWLNKKIPTLQEAYPCFLGIVKGLPVSVHFHFVSCRATFLGRYNYVKEKEKQHAIVCSIIKPNFFQDEMDRLKEWFQKEQRYKSAFRRLAQCWLYKKYRTRMLNTEDPVTMTKPTVPVYVYDSSKKGMYVFEASCIKKLIETDLAYSEWLFPESKHPKNPFTNMEFTECQKLSLLTSLRKIGFVSWMFEAYKTLKWNLDTFKLHHAISIKLLGLKELIENPLSRDSKDYLIEFIEDQYEYHKGSRGLPPTLTVLLWGVNNKTTSSYIEKWYKLFEKQFRHSILTGGVQSDYDEDIQDEIYKQSYLLLTNKELYNQIKDAYLEKNHVNRRMTQFPANFERFQILSRRELFIESDNESEEEQKQEESTTGENPILEQESNRTVINLPNGEIRIIYSMNTDLWTLRVGNPSSKVEDGSEAKPNT